MKTLMLTLLLSLAFSTAAAFADGLFRLDLGYASSDQKAGSSDTKTTRQLIDLAAGYLAQNGFAVIGQYAMEKNDTTSGGTTTEGNRTSYGPGIGYISKEAIGPYVTGTYYLSSTYVTPGVTWKGTGYQVDLGVKVQVSKVFLLGGLSYEHFDYNKTDTGPLTPAVAVTQIDPRLGLMIEF